jgi:hypothetical protein
MRVLYIEGVAIHGGPESCVGVRKGVGEALIGGVWAGLLSREMTIRSGCRRSHFKRKAMPPAALARAAGGPCAVGEPRHARSSSCARTGRSHGRPLVSMDASSGMVRGVVVRRWRAVGGTFRR